MYWHYSASFQTDPPGAGLPKCIRYVSYKFLKLVHRRRRNVCVLTFGRSHPACPHLRPSSKIELPKSIRYVGLENSKTDPSNAEPEKRMCSDIRRCTSSLPIPETENCMRSDIVKVRMKLATTVSPRKIRVLTFWRRASSPPNLRLRIACVLTVLRSLPGHAHATRRDATRASLL